jgi:hypothetical protein
MTLVWSPDYAPVDGDFDNVSLLLKGEGTNGSTTILDSSSNNLSVSVNGDAQISTAVNTPFGTGDGVLAFDGSGDTLTAPTNDIFEVNADDFTLEAWVYVLSYPGNYASVADYARDSVVNTQDYCWVFGLRNDGSVYFDSSNNTTAFLQILSGTTQIPQLTWSHIAVTREGDTFRTFANGQVVATSVKSGAIFTPSSSILKVGRLGASLNPFDGYISNLRITKGVARYTSNFTPPTAPFPIYSPTTRAQA